MRNKVKGFFITGTGTGVGKTYVSRVLVETFSKNIPISYMKPVQAGCIEKKYHDLFAPDFEYVKKSGNLVTGDDSLHAPYCFRPACSPHLAARLGRTRISLPWISTCLDRIGKLPGMKNGCVLVEGAGGVLVPLDSSKSIIHLIMRLKLPVILVTLPSLGTLNHTFLTMCALHSANVRIAGVVTNNRDNCGEDFIYRDNIKIIRKYIGPISFLEIKHREVYNRKTVEFCDELAKKYF